MKKQPPRYERRQAERKLKKAKVTYNFNNEQIEAIKEGSTKVAASQALTMMLAIPIKVLRDEEGYGKKRLRRFVDNVITVYEDFDNGLFTMDDLQKMVLEETGIDLMAEGEDVGRKTRDRYNKQRFNKAVDS